MDSKSYLVLNSWLQKADQNYIAGRLLWMNLLIDEASNLFWLSLEQMIKILLLQKEAEFLASQSKDLKEMYKKLDKRGVEIEHNVNKLIKEIKNNYPNLDINKFENLLKKINEYFYRRYVVYKGSSISLKLLDEVDEFYFLLRSNVHPEVGLGTIDEIFIQIKHKWGHPLPAFKYAYFKNEHFKTRKHREITYSLFDGSGKVYKEDET